MNTITAAEAALEAVRDSANDALTKVIDAASTGGPEFTPVLRAAREAVRAAEDTLHAFRKATY